MAIRDFARDIRPNGDALKGGEINFLAQVPRWYNTADGQRFLLFRLDENDDGMVENYTMIGVVPLQKSRDIRSILTYGGVVSVAVDHIEAEPVLAMTHPNASLRLVVGRLTLVSRGDRTSVDMDANRMGFVPAPLNALMVGSFDAAHKPVAIQLLCLDDDGGKVSHDEKQRRMAQLYEQIDAAKARAKAAGLIEGDAGTVDGDRRAIGLFDLLGRR